MMPIVSLKIIMNIGIHVLRYWGKIIGLKRNYYILECDWKNKELEYKLRVITKIFSGYSNFSGPIL